MINTSKFIKGVVSNGHYTVTAPIVKEDYGLYLKIEGLDLPAVYEVDFSNSENSGSSVTMVGNADGVLIPRQFIESGKDVFAFLYWNGEDFGRTVYKFRIPNKLRPDRTEEQPTPEEQSLIDQAINALNTAVEQTAADVETITAKAAEATLAAATATQKASEATESAQLAGTYATRAETAQRAAESARDTATAKATAAATSADNASLSAVNALDSASDAAISAGQASSSAIAAGQSALDARDYKDAANLSAESASGYAGAASESATSASESASTATTKASEAAQSATTATTKAGEASASATAAQTAQTAAEAAQTAAETAQAAAEAAVYTKADGIVDTASGAIASFPDGAEDFPMKSLKVAINPVQDLSQGDPSLDNICPISGWTGTQVVRTGKNLLDTTNAVNGKINADGSVNASPADPRKVTKMLSVKPNTAYYFWNVVSASEGRSGYWYDSSGNGIGLIVVGGANASSGTVTSPSNAAYCRVNYFATNENICMMSLGTTQPTSYEPYTGNTYSISWESEAGTVYGGTFDVVSGLLTVDKANIASYNGETLPGTWISDRDVYTQGAIPTTGAQVVYELAEPITYHLTPTEVRTLFGQNNVWADTGGSTVEYYADTKRYIDKKISELVNS